MIAAAKSSTSSKAAKPSFTASVMPWSRTHRPPVPPEPGDVVLELKDVSVTIDDREILDGISLDIRAGELLSVVGPNGAGKSTMLNAITGDVPVTGGAITLFGEPIAAWDATELAMRRSVLMQNVDVTFPFTVDEIVRMGRSPWEGTPQEMDDDMIVDSAMGMTDVAPLAPRVYTSLSGGERGRAAFSRVLAQAAPVMLLDEPTATMDVRHQELLMRLGRDYAEAGCAVVVIVHALDAAAAWSDRVALLERGRLRALGAPEEVFTAQRLSDVYQCPIEVTRLADGGVTITPKRPAIRRHVYGRRAFPLEGRANLPQFDHVDDYVGGHAGGHVNGHAGVDAERRSGGTR